MLPTTTARDSTNRCLDDTQLRAKHGGADVESKRCLEPLGPEANPAHKTRLSKTHATHEDTPDR